eukprot:scaffold218542_cov32-Tisochrysis_lutea.AAC.2
MRANEQSRGARKVRSNARSSTDPTEIHMYTGIYYSTYSPKIVERQGLSRIQQQQKKKKRGREVEG